MTKLTEKERGRAEGAMAALDLVGERDRWIPVSERLPKDNRAVLVYFGQGAWIGYYEKRDTSWHPILAVPQKVIVTHWRPLPASPIENDVRPA